MSVPENMNDQNPEVLVKPKFHEEVPAVNEIDDMFKIAEVLKTYASFIKPYESAMEQVKVWLETTKRDFADKYKHNPIHSFSYRIKTLSSISEKLNRRELEASFENAKNSLTDIAGLRVICYYLQDIYVVADTLKNQPGTIVIRESDYIENPKQNGYRTYHLIIGVKTTSSGDYYPVEVQIRTLGMDFWASTEHQLIYKHERDNHEKAVMATQLKHYADSIHQMELELGKYYDGAPLNPSDDDENFGQEEHVIPAYLKSLMDVTD